MTKILFRNLTRKFYSQQNLLHYIIVRELIVYYLEMFKTCAPLAGSKDISTLMSNLMGNWMGTVQYVSNTFQY